MELLFCERDFLRQTDYFLYRLGSWPSQRGYRLVKKNTSEKSYDVPTIYKSDGKRAFEKRLFNERHKMEVIANVLLREMRDPGPAPVMYFREVEMSREEIKEARRKKPPMYIGPPYLIKWHHLTMGLQEIRGKTVAELQSEAAVLDAFFKIGFFCGTIRKKNNMIYGDMQSAHFILRKKRLYVLDFGDVRFAEDDGEKQVSDYLNHPNYDEWLFDACQGKTAKKKREFRNGYGEGMSKG